MRASMTHAVGHIAIDLVRRPVSMICRNRSSHDGTSSDPHPTCGLEPGYLARAGKHPHHVGIGLLKEWAAGRDHGHFANNAREAPSRASLIVTFSETVADAGCGKEMSMAASDSPREIGTASSRLSPSPQSLNGGCSVHTSRRGAAAAEDRGEAGGGGDQHVGRLGDGGDRHEELPGGSRS